MPEVYAFVASLPDRSRWQSAISAVGIDLELDPELDLARDSGFSPCRLQGKASGFEISVAPSADVLRAHAALTPAVGGRGHAVCFRWGGDLAECACVLGASLALMRGFRGVAYYPADDVIYDVTTLEQELRDCLAQI